MEAPAFITRHEDGAVRAYDTQGKPLAMPSAVAAAWATEPNVCLIDIRPEPTMVEYIDRANARDRAERERRLQPRYVPTELGPDHFGVWDTQNDRWQAIHFGSLPEATTAAAVYNAAHAELGAREQG